jgi:acyl-CoA thioesterase I
VKRAFRTAVPCALFFGLWAVTGHAEPRAHTHIACIGDSITEGAGVDPSQNYVTKLRALMGDSVEVANFGHSGATMLSAGYGDLPYQDQPEYAEATTFVNDAGPDAVVSVVVLLGANDSKPGNWDPEGNDQQYLSDYRDMVEHFMGLATHPVVYLMLPLAIGESPCCWIRAEPVEEELPLIEGLAAEKQLPIIDLHTPTVGHPEYFLDGVHPNDAGHTFIATLVKGGLEQEPGTPIYPPPMTGSGGAGGAGASGAGGIASGGSSGTGGTATGGSTTEGTAGGVSNSTAGGTSSVGTEAGASGFAHSGTSGSGEAPKAKRGQAQSCALGNARVEGGKRTPASSAALVLGLFLLLRPLRKSRRRLRAGSSNTCATRRTSRTACGES